MPTADGATPAACSRTRRVRRLLACAVVIELALLSDGCTPPAGQAPTGVPGSPSVVLHLVAEDIAFDTATLRAPPGVPFQIELENRDTGIPHSVGIDTSGGDPAWRGDVFNGDATVTYDVPALAAGQYTFFCTVHLGMKGTLAVGP